MDSPCTVKMGPVWLISSQHGKDEVSKTHFTAAQSTNVNGCDRRGNRKPASGPG